MVNMYNHHHNVHHGNINPLVDTIQDCEAICEQMLYMLKTYPDVQARVMQMALLKDCADICGLTAKYIARMSPFSKKMAELCALVCEACGTECARFPDQHSQHCARVCLHCAQACRVYAMM